MAKCTTHDLENCWDCRRPRNRQNYSTGDATTTVAQPVTVVWSDSGSSGDSGGGGCGSGGGGE